MHVFSACARDHKVGCGRKTTELPLECPLGTNPQVKVPKEVWNLPMEQVPHPTESDLPSHIHQADANFFLLFSSGPHLEHLKPSTS